MATLDLSNYDTGCTILLEDGSEKFRFNWWICGMSRTDNKYYYQWQLFKESSEVAGYSLKSSEVVQFQVTPTGDLSLVTPMHDSYNPASNSPIGKVVSNVGSGLVLLGQYRDYSDYNFTTTSTDRKIKLDILLKINYEYYKDPSLPGSSETYIITRTFKGSANMTLFANPLVSFALGAAETIGLNWSSSDFTNKDNYVLNNGSTGRKLEITYEAGSKTGSSFSRDITANTRGTLSFTAFQPANKSIMAYGCPSSHEGSVKLITTTYDADGNEVDKVITKKVVSMAKGAILPKISSVTVSDELGIYTGSKGTPFLIQGQSTAKWIVSMDGGSGATITKAEISSDDQSIIGSGSPVTFTDAGVNQNFITVAMTNSRGDTATEKYTYNAFVQYYPFGIYGSFGNVTGEGKVTVKVKGQWYQAGKNISQESFSNSFTLTCRIRSVGSTQWTTKQLERFIVSGSSNYNKWGTIDKEYILTGISVGQSYEIELYAYDQVSLAQAKFYEGPITVIYSDPVFDWGQNDFNFNVPVNFNSGFTFNGKSGMGTWTPASDIATTPTAAYGNFIRIGNMCIVSWFYQATVTKGTTKVEITGLPFSPDSNFRWQSGGGSCSGGTLGLEGHSFSGWNIETGTSGYSIFGRTAAIRPSGESTLITKNSNYVGVLYGASFFSSGTIMYKVADGE